MRRRGRILQLICGCAAAAFAMSAPLCATEPTDEPSAVRTFSSDCSAVSSIAFRVLGESEIEVRSADPRSVSVQQLWDDGYGVSQREMCSSCYALRQKRQPDGTKAMLRDPSGRLIRSPWKGQRLYTIPLPLAMRLSGVWIYYSSFGLTGGIIQFEERNETRCEVTLHHEYGSEGIA